MKQQLFSPRFIAITALIIIAALTRLLPHPPNVTPIAAMALFGGAYFGNKKLVFIVPLLIMLLSDTALELLTGWGFHSGMWAVYLSFAVIAFIGLQLRNKIKPVPLIAASLGSSVVFFIITNFSMWMGSPFYTQDITGLVACFTAAIPFFRNTLFGDLFFVTMLFGLFEATKFRFPVLAKAGRQS